MRRVSLDCWGSIAIAKSTSKGNEVVTSQQGLNLVILLCNGPCDFPLRPSILNYQRQGYRRFTFVSSHPRLTIHNLSA